MAGIIATASTVESSNIIWTGTDNMLWTDDGDTASWDEYGMANSEIVASGSVIATPAAPAGSINPT